MRYDSTSTEAAYLSLRSIASAPLPCVDVAVGAGADGRLERWSQTQSLVEMGMEMTRSEHH